MLAARSSIHPFTAYATQIEADAIVAGQLLDPASDQTVGGRPELM